MAHSVLIVGKSGQGKTRSMFSLDPETTILIQAISKPLPWKGSGKQYVEGANKFVTDDFVKIEKIIRAAATSERREKPVKIIVVDDWQYCLANSYMRRAFETGFAKFTEMGTAYWKVIMAANEVKRDDLVVAFLSHSDTADNGDEKVKTIGKMLDEKITVEGMFTIVLKTVVDDSRYSFATQTNGHDNVKSPEGMFASRIIDNDLELVRSSAIKYFNEE